MQAYSGYRFRRGYRCFIYRTIAEIEPTFFSIVCKCLGVRKAMKECNKIVYPNFDS